MGMKYDFNEYLEWCKRKNIKPLVADFFSKFIDDALYKPSDISVVTGVNKDVSVNWFNKGLVINQSASNAYKGYGADIKRALFNRSNCINPIKNNPVHHLFFVEVYGEKITIDEEN